jgi:hypothetical protein
MLLSLLEVVAPCNISARLVELLFGIRENMEMAEASQRHGLLLTRHKHAPLVVVIVVVVITGFRISSLGLDVSLITLSCVLLEGTDTEFPVVVFVLELELVHEGPVVGSVAFGELLQVVGPAPEEFLACQVGGA